MSIEITIVVTCDGIDYGEKDDPCEAEFMLEDYNSSGEINLLRLSGQLHQRGWVVIPRGAMPGYFTFCPAHRPRRVMGDG